MGQPIRGMTRPLPIKASIIPAVIPPEVITLDANFNASIHNRFDIEVIDVQTGKIKQRAQAENVICSQLWTRLFAPNAYFNYIHYGTGSGTPASTDTSLFTFLGYGTPSTSDDVTSLDRANCVFSFRRKIRLSETTAVGATLTEVGIGYEMPASTLCTHAMLKDANGNQISIAKTNTDIVNIYATVYVHWSNTLYSGSILFQPSISFMMYLCGLCGISSSYFPPKHAQLSKNRSLVYAGTNGNITAIANLSSSYDLANKKISQTMPRLGVDYGNRAGGSFYLLLANYLYRDSVRDPTFALKAGSGWFPGSDITGEAIGTGDGATVDFATAFDCPSNAIVYVDGVQATGVAIDNAPLSYSNMEYYLEEIIVDNGITYPTISDGNLSGYGLYGQRTPATPSFNYSIFYNPYYSAGIKSYIAPFSSTTVEVSDDLVTWTAISANSSGTKTVPEAYRNYKYWRVTSISDGYDYVHTMTANTLTGKNIHFTTPPASGAVITADYHTPTIAKDSNHVFDLTVTIQLGEYSA